MKLVDWAEVESAGHWNNLLLGNGFSVNIHKGFGYSALLGNSDLPEQVQDLFDDLGTHDFETVMRVLASTRIALRSLGLDDVEVRNLYLALQTALLKAVQSVHPEFHDLPRNLLSAVGKELIRYQHVFTTNYDLLVYWSTMTADEHLDDGFRSWNERLSWKPNTQEPPAVYFLHGALHLVTTVTGGIGKVTRSQDGDLLRSVLAHEMGQATLFICEGNSSQKLRAIRSSPYLSHVLSRLESSTGGIVTLGHRLGAPDQHIVDAINQSGQPVAVGLYGTRAQMRQDSERITGALASSALTFFRSCEHPLISRTE